MKLKLFGKRDPSATSNGMNRKFESLSRSLARRFSIKKFDALERLPHLFTPAERLAWWLLLSVFLVSSFFVLNSMSLLAQTEVPDRGGSLTEGVIGSPRFINPLLAISDADRDLTALVYSGLLRATPDGTFIPDLAESYDISPDGLTYTFTLRENATFEDGAPVTVDDVVFTIDKARDPALKSPRRANWDGVQVEKVNSWTVRFTLRQAYAPFLENATMGILPKPLWNDSSVEQFPFSTYNTEPIGSGPYRISDIIRGKDGVPESYTLVPSRSFVLGAPYLSRLIIKFYGSEDALIDAWKHGDIESMSGISVDRLDELTKAGAHVTESPLPRVFAVFLNQNQSPIFTHAEVRRALDLSLDKKKIVEDILHGYGQAIASPIPPGIPSFIPKVPEDANTEAAIGVLEKNGWKINPETNTREKTINKKTEVLRFSLTTSNVPELKAAAEHIRSQWKAIGIDAMVKVFESGDLNQNVIRPRKYDALLFGEIVGRDLDLFAFWDSSQRNDPGLNVALYTSSTADKLLEAARSTTNEKERLEKYRSFEEQVTSDVGAIFVYSPNFIYITPQKLRGLSLGSITTPSERFDNIYHWYIETNRVWAIFAK